ncbi:MAG TPA: bacillithiol biosynthesis cysteine-adding enzyme BshC [Candidatus Acidoferrales bacterium]|nr:bacillithiol biosynthesis cysteine-adding enzyme BshC [Candidatus Acidoferrales bacterium]
MEFDCLAPNELPHVTRLYTAYLSGAKKLCEFYPHPPTLAAISSVSRERKRERRYSPEMRAAVANILARQNGDISPAGMHPAIERNLASFREGAMAVVTGQQAGLFGGPAYTFYKALTAIRLVQELHHRGVEAVPIFWIASEDHDLAEVSACDWLTSHGVEHLQWQAASPDVSGRSVGRVPLREEIVDLARRAAESLEGPACEEIAEALTTAYQPAETFGTAFAKLLRALTGRFGLILLDPLDAKLHELAAPLLERVVEQQSALSSELAERGKRLERAGYHAQVKVGAASTLLFGTENGKRVAIRQKNGEFLLGETSADGANLRRRINEDPAGFSPNALLRPVVQDTLLPTIAYVAGPAEIAYFAQSQVVYQHLGATMPVIVPRASFTLIGPYVERLIEKHSLDLRRDVLGGRQLLRKRLELNSLPRGMTEKFQQGGEEISEVLANLRKPITKLDSTLGGAVDTASRKIIFQLQKLRAKTSRARDLRDGVLTRHEKIIRDALYPSNHLQERVLSLLPFLARHGADLLDVLARHAGISTPAHQIARL